jgi:hypothetical protein
MPPRRDPNLIDRSRSEAEPGPEAEQADAAGKKRAQNDAAVQRAEVAARSWIARAIGTGDEARTAGVFIIVILIVLSSAIVFVSTSESAIRSSILDLFGKALLIGIGFLAGQGASRRR